MPAMRRAFPSLQHRLQWCPPPAQSETPARAARSSGGAPGRGHRGRKTRSNQFCLDKARVAGLVLL